MGTNIAKELAKQLKKHGKPIGVKSLTLTRSTPGTRTVGAVSAGTNPTPTSYSGSGFIEMLTASDVPGTLVTVSDRKISILGATLAVIPNVNDRVTLVDLDGTSKTFTLNATVAGDGVGAVYSFAARL